MSPGVAIVKPYPAADPEPPKSTSPTTVTCLVPCEVSRPTRSPTSMPWSLARSWLTAISPGAEGSRPSTGEVGSKGSGVMPKTRFGPPNWVTGLPSTTRAPNACIAPAAFSTCGRARTRPTNRRGQLLGLGEAAVELGLGGEDRVGALVGGLVDLLERALDPIGEHVGAGDHRHSEEHSDRGQGRAQLPLGHSPERKLGQASFRRWSRMSSMLGLRWRSTISPSPRNSTSSAVAAADASWVTITVVCP